MNLQGCIPIDKFDVCAAERANEIGFPDLNKLIPDLLVWLQDANWPVAGPVARVLSKAGPEIAPHLREILTGDDDEWKYWTVDLLIRNLSTKIQRELGDDLHELVVDQPETDQCRELSELVREFLEGKSI